jgi:hypothetical protein
MQNLFSSMVCRLIEKAQADGYWVTLGEAYRPPAVASLYASEGIGIADSNHSCRLAIDLNLFQGGAYLTSVEAYRPLGEYWKSLSGPDVTCVWGGDFHEMPDADHFSFAYDGVS